MNIRSNHLVLEIGSGHNPNPRSDILCDKSLRGDRERGGPLLIDRPAVIADGEALPFKNDAFDYVICSHVVEHAVDIERFLNEIQRVGKAGYIETPSSVAERLYGWEYHRWLIDRVENRLWIRPKTFANRFGVLFHEAVKRSREFARFHRQAQAALLTRYEWSGSIEYRIEPPEAEPRDLNDLEQARRLLEPPAWSLRQRAASALPPFARRIAKSAAARWRRAGKSPRPLQELAVCPSCHGELRWTASEAVCGEEGIAYPIVNGTPVFLLDATTTTRGRP